MNNFIDPGTRIKPPAGWMHKNKRHFQHTNYHRLKNKLPVPLEAKRIRRFGWDSMMKTEGRRKIVMERILNNEDCLTH